MSSAEYIFAHLFGRVAATEVTREADVRMHGVRGSIANTRVYSLSSVRTEWCVVLPRTYRRDLAVTSDVQQIAANLRR